MLTAPTHAELSSTEQRSDEALPCAAARGGGSWAPAHMGRAGAAQGSLLLCELNAPSSIPEVKHRSAALLGFWIIYISLSILYKYKD